MRISERLAIIQATPLRAEPGEQWHYSSPGFLLAALIVERASGQPYSQFLAERILSPLKLTRATVGGAPARAARGYRDGQPVPPWDPDAMPGTGDDPGYQSFACWIPDRAASIVILVNDEAVSVTGLLRRLLPAALEP